GSSSCAPCAWCVANWPIRPLFPPEQRASILKTVMADITKARHLNPVRRHRSYPRVVKQLYRARYRGKNDKDVGIRHNGPPTIHLEPPRTTQGRTKIKLS